MYKPKETEKHLMHVRVLHGANKFDPLTGASLVEKQGRILIMPYRRFVNFKNQASSLGFTELEVLWDCKNQEPKGASENQEPKGASENQEPKGASENQEPKGTSKNAQKNK